MEVFTYPSIISCERNQSEMKLEGEIKQTQPFAKTARCIFNSASSHIISHCFFQQYFHLCHFISIALSVWKAGMLLYACCITELSAIWIVPQRPLWAPRKALQPTCGPFKAILILSRPINLIDNVRRGLKKSPYAARDHKWI